MNHPNLLRTSLVLFAATLGVARLAADVVETKNGARIVGKVSKIDAGLVVISTDFAGVLNVKQTEVTSIVTDTPLSVRLISGTRIDGKIAGGAGGGLQVAGADGTISTSVDKVAAVWPAGDRDPQLAMLDRAWAYEAAVDIAGKSGNKSALATSGSLRATLKGLSDTLAFYTAYDREVTDGAKSADQFKAGTDYQSNFAGKSAWYVRDEGGFDRIKDIKLYNTAAAGFGYDFIKQPKHELTARIGLAYRYENYTNPTTEDVNSAGLDLQFNHTWEFKDSSLVNRVAYDPAFNDFSNFRLTHESFYEMPLTNPMWKIRFGVSNDYNSKPGIGIDKLDTTYFTRLVLSWK